MQTGKVVSMRINVGKRAPMLEVEDANFITYEGIEGDRHRKAPSQMKYSSTASVSSIPKRQILLMDLETLEEFDLFAGQIRENVNVEGLDFSEIHEGDMVKFESGVILEITGICDPCAFIDGIRPGLRNAIDGRRGLLAFVQNGGSVKVGTTISVETP